MAFGTSIGKGSFKLHQQDRWWGYFYLSLIIAAALILFTVNLGNHPLDPLETTTAEIAESILRATQAPSQTPADFWRIFPGSGAANLWQPLYPHLVALAYHFGGVSPLMTRLPAALLGALTTAFVYGVGRELFRAVFPALLACCVYITCFLAISQGRLATADAPVVCFEMFVLWAILRSRRSLSWSLLAGLGLSLVVLTDLGAFFPLFALITLFLLWDTPRLLSSAYFYFGIFLGIIPLIVWGIGQYYYEPAIDLEGRIWSLSGAIDANSAQKWLLELSFRDYLTIALSYCSPWLVVAISGLRLAWYHRNWGWAKFLLTASSISGLFGVLAIANNVSVLPIYPILALAAGIELHQLRNLPSYISYPQSWISLFGSLAMIFLVLGICGKFVFEISFSWLFVAMFASIVATLTVSSLLIHRRNFQFVSVAIWGSYLSLLLVFGSQYVN